MTSNGLQEEVRQERRSFLTATAAVAALAGFAGSASANQHEGHSHPARDRGLIDGAQHCISMGQACKGHCLDMFKMGDTSLAKCAGTAEDLIAACTAMSQLATSKSEHLTAMSNVCKGVCESCREECMKHAAKHAACKDCADACTAMLDQLKKAA